MPLYAIILLVVFILLVLFLVIPLVIVGLIHKKMFGFHQNEVTSLVHLSFNLYQDELQREAFSMNINKKDTIQGYYYYDKSITNFKGFVILSPGYGGGHQQYFIDIYNLCSNGYKVMAYDNVGTAYSHGKSMVCLGKGAKTLNSVLKAVVSQNLNENLKITLYGHSWGAYSVLAGTESYVENIVAVAGFSDPVKSVSTMIKENVKFLKFISPYVFLFYHLFYPRYCTKAFNHYSLLELKPRVLVIYAKDDKSVLFNISQAYKFMQNEYSNVEVFLLEEGGHYPLLSVEGQKKFKEFSEEITKLQLIEEKQLFVKNINLREEYKENDDLTEKIIEFLNNSN